MCANRRRVIQIKRWCQLPSCCWSECINNCSFFLVWTVYSIQAHSAFVWAQYVIQRCLLWNAVCTMVSCYPLSYCSCLFCSLMYVSVRLCVCLSVFVLVPCMCVCMCFCLSVRVCMCVWFIWCVVCCQKIIKVRQARCPACTMGTLCSVCLWCER